VSLYRILLSGAAEALSSKAQMELLRAGMQAVSLAEDKDYIFEIRAADSDSRRFPALATSLLALHPAAIVASTNLAITSSANFGTVPIVGASLNSPVAVASSPASRIRVATSPASPRWPMNSSSNR